MYTNKYDRWSSFGKLLRFSPLLPDADAPATLSQHPEIQITALTEARKESSREAGIGRFSLLRRSQVIL